MTFQREMRNNTMTQQELLKDLLIKLKKYKNCETLLRYLDNLEECFNEMNKKYSIEAFPTKYITEQKKIITDVIQENNRDITCKECVKFLKEKEKLLSTTDSVFEYSMDMDLFLEQCKKTCEHFSKDIFSYYLNDEGVECIDSMIEVFGIEKTKDFCLLNAYKFFWRCDKKDQKWDVDKGLGYLTLYKKLCDREKSE